MLNPILQSLLYKRVRPLNCALIAAPPSLLEGHQSDEQKINVINIAPPVGHQACKPADLKIFPNAWADLVLVDPAAFQEAEQEHLWLEISRITAAQGLMVAVGPEAPEAEHGRFRLFMAESAATVYVQSFGSEIWDSAGKTLHWAKRNARLYFHGDSEAKHTDHLGCHASELTGKLDELRQELSLSLDAWIQTTTAIHRDELSALSDRLLPLHDMVRDLQRQIHSLSTQLDERLLPPQQPQDELNRSTQQQTNAQQARGLADHPEPQGDSTDPQLAEILALRSELAAMTASYLEMRSNLQALLDSGFWRLTWLPRRLLDRLKASLRSSGLTVRPRLLQVLPGLRGRTSDRADASVPAAEAELRLNESSELGTPSWQKLWPGTFLNLKDIATATTQDRMDRILFVDWRLPEPDQDSGSCRIFAILEIAASLGLQVDFISDARNQSHKYRRPLLKLGINVIEGRPQGVRQLQRFGGHYRQCIVCRPEPASFYFPLIRCYSPEAQLIYDTVDLHYSRFHRGSQLPGLEEEKRAELLSLHHQYKAAESFFARTADQVIVVTENERREVEQTIAPECPIIVLPNIHPLPERNSLPGWDKRKDLLFVGGFDHAPNVDAALYFCEHILPLILGELPDIRVHLVGSNMPDQLHDLKSPHINPIGFVEELREIFDQVRVFVAPLRYGAGLKGKVGQSMSYGVPVVGTSIAFEGFGIDDHQQGVIADQPDDFARGVIEVYGQVELWSQLSNQAWQVIESRFSNQAARRTLEALFQSSAH